MDIQIVNIKDCIKSINYYKRVCSKSFFAKYCQFMDKYRINTDLKLTYC